MLATRFYRRVRLFGAPTENGTSGERWRSSFAHVCLVDLLSTLTSAAERGVASFNVPAARHDIAEAVVRQSMGGQIIEDKTGEMPSIARLIALPNIPRRSRSAQTDCNTGLG